MFAALNRIYRQVIGKPLVVEKVMGDADAAQLNGVTQGFGGSAQLNLRTTKARVLAEWAYVPVLATFTTYFKSQWLTGRFTSWQVYHKLRGWATTIMG
ncbi:hypothetical protein PC118_g14865 [Phytophthora cactorum]|uniref:Uncharacterized protein n=1 Tax=Phytophthora cactorum TaxID=29920 RepID=A0A8T1BQP6_9STRA|nr:hypothetical protein PC115_g14146 [Phytophthora cactorum]KAG2912092.1 hypothetical protein PC114_g9079 [Phytophthora cactorum]KAG2973874.1 hypothetical protein PC118_g14865 [Phytophthora cactorum]KAG3027033.1 hypothetical protein PC119_g7548 [Phytophthora cactorum]KAG3165981.1 hypothetical protein C6341_g12169 [Phytophthora cactorum]